MRRIIRIGFSKLGDIKYVPHLSLASAFERALRRAGAPLWYSEGFNPHPKLNFALPLSVGCESVCEMCDVSVEEDSPPDCLDGLAAQMPRGLEIYRIKADPERKFSEIGFCRYRVIFDVFSDAGKLEKILSGPLVVMKRSKKGDAETDVSPMIEESRVSEENGRALMDLTLCAGGERGYLNPELILRAAESEIGSPDCRIIRTEVLDLEKKPFWEEVSK